ncbi:MAG: hydrogenase maturation protease [Candidatus Bathyarchaeota archaeon]|nr:hydrogenase maturation protease [Candidatus Bathyarchaeota archaeon]
MSWEEELENHIDKNTVIMGIGSELKSDDRVGLSIAESLLSAGKYNVIVAGPTPEHWVGYIANKGYEKILIVDAVTFGGIPGEIQVFDINEISKIFGLTHASSLHLFADFLSREGELQCIKILAIQPESLKLGTELSTTVKDAADEIIHFLKNLSSHSK